MSDTQNRLGRDSARKRYTSLSDTIGDAENLKERDPSIKIIAIEPVAGHTISGQKGASYLVCVTSASASPYQERG